MEWTCNVCGFSNVPSRTSAVAALSHTPRCALCGVIKTAVPDGGSVTQASGTGVASGLSSLSASTTGSPHLLPRPELNAGGEGYEVPCPRCTFLNRPELKQCEVCAGALPSVAQRNGGAGKGASPTSGLDSPVPTLTLPPAEDAPRPASSSSTTNEQPREMAILRVSFRKGGEKEFHKRLRTVLTAKAWERQSLGGGHRRAGTNGVGSGGGGGEERTGKVGGAGIGPS